MSGVYVSVLTPHTNMGASFEGAEMTTFLTESPRCAPAASLVVNTPVDSTTTSTPAEAQSMLAGRAPRTP